MEVSSLRRAQPSCHPIKLESCWRWVIIAYILNIWVFEASNEGVHCWLGKSALKMSSGVCSVLLLLFSLCFPGIHLPFSSKSPTPSPPAPPADPTQPALPQQQTTASIPGPSHARSACRLEKGVHTAMKRWEEKTAEITVPKRRFLGTTFVLVLSKEGLEPCHLQFDFHTLKISEQ